MLLLPRVAAAALLLVAGCGGEPAGGPPEIQYGLEECGYCRMIISEEKFAAATVDVAGTTTRFDDVGCLIDYLREQSAAPGRAGGAQMASSVWVHDHATGGWTDAESAWFIQDPRGATPMGSGLVAFASRQEAEAFAAGRSMVVKTWGEIAVPSPESSEPELR